MNSDQLREQGIAALKERRLDDAKRLLAEAIKLNPRDAEAWAYMGVMAADAKARLMAFRRALEIDSGNKTALTSLKALGIDPVKLLENRPEPPKPAAPPAAPKPLAPIAPIAPISPLGTPPTDPKLSTTENEFNALFGGSDDIDPSSAASVFGITPPKPTAKPSTGDLPPKPRTAPLTSDPFGGALQDDDPTSAPLPAIRPADTGRLRPPKPTQSAPGVPVPDESYLVQAADAAEAAVQRAPQMNSGGIAWVKKAKNRAGEGDVWQLRLQAGAAIFAAVLVIGFVLISIARSPEAQRLVGIRTSVPSRTPTVTPTPTPGVTPTPTATPNATQIAAATPLPPSPVAITPLARIDRTPVPTDIFGVFYFPLEGVMPRAVGTLNAGDATSVLPTLNAEVTLVSVTFNPNPYYFKAIAQARTGDYDGALDTLAEVEERLENETRAEARPFARAFVQSAFAEVELMRAQDLRRRGNPARASSSYTEAVRRAELALESNAQIATAYVVLATVALDQRRFEDALDILDDAASPEVGSADLINNLDLIGLRGQVHLTRAATLGGSAADDELALADAQGQAAFFVNPYDRRGHELRIQVALAQERAGDAVLLNDTYRLYFPNDPRALKLLGDARQIEGNPDLAFIAYSDAATAAVTATGGIGPAAAEALVARAQLLLAEGDGGAALADLNAAYEALPDASIRAQRMDAAYAAGQYDLALEDAQALVGSEVAPDDVFFLMQARVRYDLAAAESPEVLAEAAADVLSLLSRTGGGLTGEQRAVAEAYRARAALVSGDLELANASVNTAFGLTPSPALQILRADVRTAQGRFDEARADYLEALDAVADVDESLALLARDGLERLPGFITATASAVTATAQGFQTATAEVNATATATATAATATAAAAQTQTATLLPSPTPTVTPTPTDEPSATPEPTEEG